MKAGIFVVGAAALLQLTTALPQRFVPREQKVEVTVETVVVRAEVEVYTDDKGNPVATSTIFHTLPAGENPVAPTQAPATSELAPPIPEPSAPAPSAPASPNPAPAPTTQAPAPAPAPPAPQPSAPAPEPSKPDPAPVPVSHSDGSFGSGIAYAPFKADGTCKTADDVKKDVAALAAYDVIRIYGVECNMVSNVLTALQGNQKIWAGIYDIDQVQTQAQSLITQVNNRWDKINTVNVGNEHVQTGKASVGQVTGAIGQARGILRGAGYNGPVVTVDTMMTMQDHIELCAASDFCAINCHAFFDGNVEAKDAGQFVAKWVQKISQLAGGKKTVVAESGWPSGGGQNKAAIPAKNNQAVAIGSLKAALPANLVLYSAFDNLWLKDNAATFGVEQHWGILGTSPSS